MWSRRPPSPRWLAPGPPWVRVRCGMERETTLQEVRTFETRGGNVRYVVRDAEGNDVPGGDRRQRAAAGRSACPHPVSSVAARPVHERLPRRGRGALGREATAQDTEPEEAAWRTAVDAAPWLVGSK